MSLSIRRVSALQQQTGVQYSAMEWNNARVAVQSIVASPPQLDTANRLKTSTRNVNFFRSGSKCRRNVSVYPALRRDKWV